MANTLELISAIRLTSTASSIDFTSIPNTYTDLLLLTSLRGDGSQNWGNITINGGGVAISMMHILNNSGSVISQSYSPLRVACVPNSFTSDTFSSGSLYISNYANTSYSKSMSVDSVQENNSTTNGQNLAAGLWADNSAINRITFRPDGGFNFVPYSSISLYGIKNS